MAIDRTFIKAGNFDPAVKQALLAFADHVDSLEAAIGGFVYKGTGEADGATLEYSTSQSGWVNVNPT